MKGSPERFGEAPAWRVPVLTARRYNHGSGV